MGAEKILHAFDWLTIIMVSYFALIAGLKAVYPKRFRAFIRLPQNSSYFTDLSQEKDRQFLFTFFTEGILILGLSVFIYLFVAWRGIGILAIHYSLFFRILIVALLFITLQRFLHSLTGLLFDMRKPFSQFLTIKDGHLQWAALILFLFSLLTIYSGVPQQFIIVPGIIFLFAAYAIGVVRAALLVDNKTFSGMQLFFYLCALEILPILCLVKLIA